MDTELLSGRLRSAVAEVRPRPGFADDVTRGARRQVRHRRTITAVAVAVLVTATGATLLTGRDAGDAPPARNPELLDLLDGPTRGDLATDRRFVDAAAAAWRVALPTSPNADHYTGRMLGEPHVYWAGSTPAGPAAVVAQQVRQGGVALGLYGGDQSGQRILTDVPPVAGAAGVAFQFGADDRTLLAIDTGRPMVISDGVRRDQDGRVDRTWRSLAAVDGVAWWQAPAGVDASAVRVALTDPSGAADRDAAVLTLPASRYGDGFDRQSKHRTEHRLDWHFLNQTNSTRPVVGTWGIEGYLERAGMLDPFLRVGAGGTWNVAAVLPDGRTAWVTEYQQDSSPSRVYAVIGNGWRVVDGGPVDAAAPLPVKIKMPYRLGWVVAADGAVLRYRTGDDGPWIGDSRDAALLPYQATEVEVAHPGRAPVVVPLG